MRAERRVRADALLSQSALTNPSSPPVPKSARYQYASLEGWRGAMAILAVIYHAPVIDHVRHTAFIGNVFLCLEFFFVLSGFVICRVYADRVGDPRGLGAFVLRRFGRMWPLHVFVLAVLVLMEFVKLALVANFGAQTEQPPFEGSRSWSSLLSNVLMIHSLGIHDELTWNVPSWSISCEFYTYLLFAGVVSSIGPRLRQVAYLLLAFAALAVLAMNWTRQGLDLTYNFGIFRCISGFFIGCFVATVQPSLEARMRRPGVAAFLEIGVVVGFVAFIVLAGRNPTSLLSAFVFGAVVLVFSADGGPVSRLLMTRPFQTLGALSYSVYLVHWPILNVFMHVARRMDAADPGSVIRIDTDAAGLTYPMLSGPNLWVMDGVTLALFVLTLAASFVTYRWVEMPGRRAFGRWAQRLESRTSPGPPAGPISDVAAPGSGRL